MWLVATAALGLAPGSTLGLAPTILATPPAAAATVLGGTGRSKMVWEVLRRGDDPFSAANMAGFSGPLRSALSGAFSPPVHPVGAAAVSSCGTRKLLLALPSGEIETVIIPDGSGTFSTICVSSQVGCRQACSFCATGAMGLRKSLGAEEILAQIHAGLGEVAAAGLPPLRNVVFMGMGE